MTSIPPEYSGWWRIVETPTWMKSGLDLLGPVDGDGDDAADRQITGPSLFGFWHSRSSIEKKQRSKRHRSPFPM